MELPYDPAIPVIYLGEMKTCPDQNLSECFVNVHSSGIHISQKVVTTEMSIN